MNSITKSSSVLGGYLLAGLVLVCLSNLVEARPAKHDKKHYTPLKYSHHSALRYNYPVGKRVTVLPAGYLSLSYAGLNYYFHAGTYYRRVGRHYDVVRPPVGLGIRALPAGHRSYRHKNRTYYFANGIYYRWDDFHRHYVVVNQAETGIEVPETVAQVSEQYVYPSQGQDATQASMDRYECYVWAAGQTGVDPALAATADSSGSLQDYQRANAACLEARGYSVR